ncbi:NAD(P)H-binding protein [Streptomyces botrytidirepellens]|uniref:SDR family NAD(P)-dependent oxidoreductase n=1 Tax=Streptomyces botrytidirepellens TaxID=2486417 RepID=A0A3M8WYS9_9ACTN|nr:NAD(P)H-binding protein [Streptomyces botrytidirepellens]RNG34544.1 SDR family NAD(P)-dependent oxidoreductase [Streptomyces botrytidirepellens]
MSNGNDTTLILGATGKTGRRIAARLRLRGTPVRAASRSSRTRFDWSDPRSWDAALRGIAAVYVVAPSVPGPVHEFVARAEAAGVRRLVLLSGHGADTWGDSTFGLDMRSAEDAVRGSALEWTVLRPSNFAQNFDEDVFHAPLVAGELALPAGAVPEPFIDVEDVADAAATVLTEPGRHAGRVYELTGPRALTFGEAVELIARASGRPLTYRQISPAEYAATLVGEGLSEDDAHHVAEMFVMMERGLIAATTDDLATLLGRAPRTFEDYVVRAAAAGAWGR